MCFAAVECINLETLCFQERVSFAFTEGLASCVSGYEHTKVMRLLSERDCFKDLVPCLALEKVSGPELATSEFLSPTPCLQ